MSEPIVLPITRSLSVEIPGRFRGCDIVEVRVSLTPLSIVDTIDGRHERQTGEAVYSQYQIARVEARDHRALFHVARHLLSNLFLEYFGVKL